MSGVDTVTFVPVPRVWWITNFGGLVTNAVVARRRRSRGLGLLFAVAAATHVAEAVHAWRFARRAGLDADAGRWAVQTLGVGFPSVLALHDLVAERAEAAARVWHEGTR